MSRRAAPPIAPDEPEVTRVPLFPGEDWLKAYVCQINSSKAYAECAVNWEGDVTFLFEPEPLLLVPAPIYSWLDLWHGKCRAARYNVPPTRVIWRSSSSGPLLALEAGDPQGARPRPRHDAGQAQGARDLHIIARHVKAADELVRIAGQVPTTFIDEC